MSAYERVGDHPVSSDALELAARLAANAGRELEDFILSGDAAREIARALSPAPSPHQIQGRRTEEMFGYVVSALGATSAVKQEDGGHVLVAPEMSIAVPDYRLLVAGREILVEVKNCHSTSVKKPIRLKQEYLQRLAAYGRLFDRPVYIAIYWSGWNIWTLHPVQELSDALSRGVSLSFRTAVMASHMSMLGDATLGTVRPLRLRMATTSKRILGDRKKAIHQIVVRSVRIFAGANEILDRVEKNIAFYFMLNGGWSGGEPQVQLENDEVREIEFTCIPLEANEDVPFSLVGSASSMLSANFRSATSADGKIKQLKLTRGGVHPLPNSDEEYLGARLPLWRFIQQPRTILEAEMRKEE